MSSLRQLADQLQLSHATVSAALRGLSTVKAATRERVLKAAAESGYQANPLASALMGEIRRSRSGVFRGVVALLHLEISEPTSFDYAARKVICAAAAARAAELGFKADVIVASRDGYDLARLTEILTNRGISGLLVLAPADRSRFSCIDWTLFAALHVGLGNDHVRMNSVCPDYFGAMRMALKNLRTRGYSRPGLVLRADTEVSVLELWKAAYTSFVLEAAGAGGQSPPPQPYLYAAPEADAFTAWLALGGYDVVLTDLPQLPEGWSEAGTPPSARTSFCGLNLLGPEPSLAGIELRFEAVGRKGVDLLTDQILRNERAGIAHPTVTLCPPCWHDGPSLRALAKAAKPKSPRRKS